MTEPFSTIGAIADRLSDGLLEVEGPLPTTCWQWLGTTTDGYGYIRWNGYKWRTNRLSWYLHYGDIPEGLWVLHHCDNRACCNPDHLFLGNAQDNTDDMENKGRDNYARQGEEHHNAVLKASEVIAIRAACAEGASHTELAKQYGVKPSAIDKIASCRTWRHVS